MVVKSKRRTPVRQVTGKTMLGRLKRRIRTYERRYEIHSSLMPDMVKSGKLPETAEILGWKQDLHALKLLSGQTRTNGTLSSSTG